MERSIFFFFQSLHDYWKVTKSFNLLTYEGSIQDFYDFKGREKKTGGNEEGAGNGKK